MQRETVGYVVGFTFLVTFTMAILLAFAHSSTVEIVERNEMVRRQSTVLSAIGIDVDSADEVFDEYSNLERIDLEQLDLDDLAEGGPGLYIYSGQQEPIIARQFSGPGVWGEIVAVISVNSDVTRVIGVEILDQNETPGLGGRVTTREFLDQLRGEAIGPDGIHVVVRGPGDYDPDNAQIDGITGATGTTRSFDRMLNRELEALKELVARSADEIALLGE